MMIRHRWLMKIRWKMREMKGMEKRSGCDCGEVVRVEDGNDDEVEGSADAEAGVAMVEKVRTDPGVVDRVVGHGKSDDDSAGEDEPPKTGGTVPRIFFCIPFATPVKNASDGPQDQIFLRFSGQLLVEKLLILRILRVGGRTPFVERLGRSHVES
jgi:hypothetical protein